MLRLITMMILIALIGSTLSSCASFHRSPTIAQTSELLKGKRDFENGYYLDAMHRLLPLACDGDPQAEYAVGYMFYYGYGVGQDTVIGCFWMQRAANKGYPPAIEAMKTAAINNINKPGSLTITPPTQAQVLSTGR